MPAVIILIVLIAADQLLKWWTVSHLALGESAPLIPGVIQLTRLHNTGAAWSSFSGETALLTAVTLVLMAAVAVLLVKKIVRHRLGVAACPADSRRRARQHDRPRRARLRRRHV